MQLESVDLLGSRAARWLLRLRDFMVPLVWSLLPSTVIVWFQHPYLLDTHTAKHILASFFTILVQALPLALCVSLPISLARIRGLNPAPVVCGLLVGLFAWPAGFASLIGSDRDLLSFAATGMMLGAFLGYIAFISQSISFGKLAEQLGRVLKGLDWRSVARALFKSFDEPDPFILNRLIAHITLGILFGVTSFAGVGVLETLIEKTFLGHETELVFGFSVAGLSFGWLISSIAGRSPCSQRRLRKECDFSHPDTLIVPFHSNVRDWDLLSLASEEFQRIIIMGRLMTPKAWSSIVRLRSRSLTVDRDLAVRRYKLTYSPFHTMEGSRLLKGIEDLSLLRNPGTKRARKGRTTVEFVRRFISQAPNLKKVVIQERHFATHWRLLDNPGVQCTETEDGCILTLATHGEDPPD